MKKTVQYDGSFLIRDYNHAAPFSSFLPGIAGLWGKPLWAFYVNRGQAICSAGVRDKDGAILEFKSANAAYRDVFTQGFRTLLKIKEGAGFRHHEPFRTHAVGNERFMQTMRISPHELSVDEQDTESGLGINATYFTLPNEDVPGLVRIVTLTNASRQAMEIQLLDGIPSLIPFGTSDEMVKNMRTLAQTYALVSGVSARVPLFRIKLSGDDNPIVGKVTNAHFLFGYGLDAPGDLLEVVVDPSAVFGDSSDPELPERFLRAHSYSVPKRQALENVLPSAMVFSRCRLAPGQQRSFVVCLGNAPSARVARAFATRARRPGYVEKKRIENRRETERVSDFCAMASGDARLDAYACQNFLDNALRGGLPVTLRKGRDPLTLNVYSRKHGDLERDYNFFVVEPIPFSQGEGNYRDVNQNRRMDVFFNPDVAESSLRYFLNLVQADGFTPNLVQPGRFRCAKTRNLTAFLGRAVDKEDAQAVADYVTTDFELGHLFQLIEQRSIRPAMKREAFLEELLEHAEAQPAQDLGSGYHPDTWFYNLDLLDSYRGIYPERFCDLLFKRSDFYYGDNYAFVKHRNQRYAMLDGRPMQPDSIEHDEAKKAMMDARPALPYAMRTKHGEGDVYYTTLAPKLVALAAVKLASLDAFGAGVEMESDRSNWYDALSGLPGVFGSSTHETFALKRLLLFLCGEIRNAPTDYNWSFPEEIAEFIQGLSDLLAKPPRRRTFAQELFTFWDAASDLKETFRADIRMGFAGKTRSFDQEQIVRFVGMTSKKVEAGLRRSRDTKTGLYHGYYRHELAKYKIAGNGMIIPRAFRHHALPLFLETQVHALRAATPHRTGLLAKAVKTSALYDRKLKMYKLNTCLDTEPMDIGRTRGFARGWLENESIWLHMEYKYLLELLRAGLHREFYEAFKTCGIPFLDPAVYGRSTTENVSFIVSSAYPDKQLVGRGFQARLTGATAEFVNIWILMCVGDHPFRLSRKGELTAVFEPALPDWLFTKKPGTLNGHKVPAKSFAFVFLGHTVVTYRQKGQVRDTFGDNPARIESIRLVYDDGREVNLQGATIPEPDATALRERQIASATCMLGAS